MILEEDFETNFIYQFEDLFEKPISIRSDIDNVIDGSDKCTIDFKEKINTINTDNMDLQIDSNSIRQENLSNQLDREIRLHLIMSC